MKIFSVYNPVKKCISAMKKVALSKPSVEAPTVSAQEILAEQNRVLVKPINQIEPEKIQFKSTKEMFAYAKKKCVDALKDKNPYEYSVVMDTKKNKILAEYSGDAHHCEMLNLDSLSLDLKNTAIMHGHPDSYPLSSPDVRLLLGRNINQVIAVDINGQFSMMYKKVGTPVAEPGSKACINFDNKCMDNVESFYEMRNPAMKKGLIDYTLRVCADDLGLRYITNYDYLRKTVK